MMSFVLAFALAFPIGSALFRLLTSPGPAVARRRANRESEKTRRTGAR